MTGLNSVGSNVATVAAKTLITAKKGDMTAATEALKTANPNQPVANDAFTGQNTGSTCASGACPFHQT